MATTDPRTSTRVLNYGEGPPDDGHDREWDVCPVCGGKRWQLVIVPDRFHCDRCEKSSVGPNAEAPAVEPEQMGLIGSFVEPDGGHVEVTDGKRTFGVDDFEPADAGPTLFDPKGRAIADRARGALESATEEAPPIDEADAWIADEMPDE